MTSFYTKWAIHVYRNSHNKTVKYETKYDKFAVREIRPTLGLYDKTIVIKYYVIIYNNQSCTFLNLYKWNYETICNKGKW